MSYAPKPGTAAFRILAWLRHEGETEERNTSQIGNALDIDNRAVTASLEQALRERLVFARRKDPANVRAPIWYSLTDHSPAAPSLGWQAPSVPTFRGRASNTPTGDQPRSERGREVMEPAVCESAAGRGTTGAPALATLPHYASPGVGPMGAGQPADAGPTGGVAT